MKRFKDILCVVDPCNDCHDTLDRAVALAENNQASLTVIAVAPRMTAGIGMPGGGPITMELQSTAVSKLEEDLQSFIEPHRQRVDITSRVLVGTPFITIIREVLKHGHDIVIKCPESLDWMDSFFSSDDMHLFRKCPCPVWIVKPQKEESYKRILVAVDVDDNYAAEEREERKVLSEMIMQMAASLAVSEFAELHVAHAWEVMGESAMRYSAFIKVPDTEVEEYVEQVRRHNADLLEGLMKDVSDKLGQDAMNYIKPQLHMVKGSARKLIPELAKELKVDCIVMGTVGRTGVPGFFIGNTAENILNQIECSVLAVKPPGFVTPVTVGD